MSSAAPTRLLNREINPYWGMLDKNIPQSAVYIHGEQMPQGLEGGFPTWVPIEFPAMNPFATQDAVINLPDDFSLLSFFGTTSDPAGAAVQLYDLNRKMWLVDQAIDMRTIAGALGKVLLERIPFNFGSENQQLFIRIANQSANVNDVMATLYGIQGGDKS